MKLTLQLLFLISNVLGQSYHTGPRLKNNEQRYTIPLDYAVQLSSQESSAHITGDVLVSAGGVDTETVVLQFLTENYNTYPNDAGLHDEIWLHIDTTNFLKCKKATYEVSKFITTEDSYDLRCGATYDCPCDENTRQSSPFSECRNPWFGGGLSSRGRSQIQLQRPNPGSNGKKQDDRESTISFDVTDMGNPRHIAISQIDRFTEGCSAEWDVTSAHLEFVTYELVMVPDIDLDNDLPSGCSYHTESFSSASTGITANIDYIECDSAYESHNGINVPVQIVGAGIPYDVPREYAPVLAKYQEHGPAIFFSELAQGRSSAPDRNLFFNTPDVREAFHIDYICYKYACDGSVLFSFFGFDQRSLLQNILINGFSNTILSDGKPLSHSVVWNAHAQGWTTNQWQPVEWLQTGNVSTAFFTTPLENNPGTAGFFGLANNSQSGNQWDAYDASLDAGWCAHADSDQNIFYPAIGKSYCFNDPATGDFSPSAQRAYCEAVHQAPLDLGLGCFDLGYVSFLKFRRAFLVGDIDVSEWAEMIAGFDPATESGKNKLIWWAAGSPRQLFQELESGCGANNPTCDAALKMMTTTFQNITQSAYDKTIAAMQYYESAAGVSRPGSRNGPGLLVETNWFAAGTPLAFCPGQELFFNGVAQGQCGMGSGPQPIPYYEILRQESLRTSTYGSFGAHPGCSHNYVADCGMDEWLLNGYRTGILGAMERDARESLDRSIWS